ncbi:alpha/beta hydrolase [Paenibacillus sp. MER TA 81-3]|uniref:alpha/beta hydrolase n=1 Tax=Paenibacillus sp. MER TA 81-3 TaxID=2939573 RepID=UPI002040362A|nr:alpha/beta hydrolase [Paenibacillus sp. MER TA 81-3]MCM3340931.1 alpha/beta hydrolase [Paenibacillus sp. MER TA 81-3]
MKKRLLIVSITILALLLIVITSASFYFYHVAIARAEKSFLKGNPDLAVSASVANPFDDNEEWWGKQAFTEWSMTSNDGLKLHAYYLAAAQQTDKTVIIAHGYSGHAEQMGHLAQMYRDVLGYNVLLPDARGHGKSEGNYIGFGWPERKDYVKWIDKVIEHTGDQAQIVLHGVSMGGATVMMTSGEDLPPNVKAIVEDCGYTSVTDELTYQLQRMYHLPSVPIVQTTSLLTKIRAGYSFGEASALEQIKKSKTPMLFIHGGADLFVPTEMVYELYENGPAQKKMLIVPGAGHGMARQTDPEGYDREVAQFIGMYVK